MQSRFWRQAVSTLGAVTLVFLLPLQAQAPPELRLTRDLRIDAAEQDLSPITWLAVAPNGTIAVTQNQDGLVRYFDSRGVALGTFGRKGQGPGEFQGVGRLTWIADTLVVADVQQRRFTLISPDRKLVRTAPWLTSVTLAAKDPAQTPRLSGGFPRIRFANGDQLLTTSVAEGSPTPQWPGGNRPGTPFLRVDSTGAVQKVIAWSPPDECTVSYNFGGGGYGMARVPYCALNLEEVAIDGSRLSLAYVERNVRATYRVQVFRQNGDTLFSRAYNYTAIPIPKNVRDSVMEGLSTRGPPEQRAALGKAQLPESYPPLSRLLPGRDESTWIETYYKSGALVRRWLVLDARGNAIGDLQVPRNLQIMVASREMVWAIETDDDGLQHIVRFRVTR